MRTLYLWFMVITYIIILCFSATLASASATRVAARLTRLLALPTTPPSGIFAAISAITFLTVLGMPAMLLTGAVALLVVGTLTHSPYLPRIAPIGVPLIAVALGLGSVSLPVIGSVPPLALVGALAACWFAFLYSARFLPSANRPASLGIVAALLPFLATTLLFSAPHYLALDALILACALGGPLLARGHSSAFGGSKTAFAHLLFWLMLQTMLHGAWPCALASLLAWLGAIAYGSSRSPNLPVTHAPSI